MFHGWVGDNILLITTIEVLCLYLTEYGGCEKTKNMK